MNLLTTETYHNEFLCQEKNIYLLLIFYSSFAPAILRKPHQA